MIPLCDILVGNTLAILPTLPAGKFRCCVTSPPYFGLRDYGNSAQIGLESSPQAYVAKLVAVFDEVRRVLTDDGTLWVNLGDTYAANRTYQVTDNKHIDVGNRTGSRVPEGLKQKDLIGIPWRVAFALQESGWWLRSDIIWAKPNPMPESVTDRPTRSHEYLFLLAKQEKYFYDAEAIKEPASESSIARINQPNFDAQTGGAKDYGSNGTNSNRSMRKTLVNWADKQRGHSRRHDGFNDRWDKMERDDQCSGMRNKRDVWTVPPANYAEAHFATFPPALIQPCVLAGSAPGDHVIDPFFGSGTTGEVAIGLGRNCTGIELNPEYAELAKRRTAVTGGLCLT